uniref:Ribosome maturation factor RimP n=1 Tax=Candidatus Kentrum sp. MB TaxID=2138164 RepID=A0A450XDJ1_9GAMM|nr:MAG: ribosome maturation factor RimP [Candidatus Kentron sp. MB]VFK33607.1 MAG: ribosome maturation factor RimP [Candidatus Kentron sp. MB]VFK76279.1 MAG: ribosome maturation factor RimP [Candidatus Kentron sp. MB]
MRAFTDRLSGIIEPAVTGLGYELIGVQYSPGWRRALVRIYIDHPMGIGVDDCERVSRQISGVLDVENPIREQYTLEVSSPGLDRPLFKLDHFQQFTGHRVRVKFYEPWAGRRNITGELLGCHLDTVIVLENGTEHRIPLGLIGLARLVPEY